MTSSFVTLSIILLMQLFSILALADSIPNDAKMIISKVNKAAKKQDGLSLRSLMSQEFIWSFGGDSSADQAIQSWQERPVEFKRLASVTSKQCSMKSKNEIECPKNAKLGYRAGFKKINENWHMVYFVAGD